MQEGSTKTRELGTGQDLPGDNHTAQHPPLSYRAGVWSLVLSLVVLGIVLYTTFDLAAFRRLPTHFNMIPLAVGLVTVWLRVFFGGWRLNYFSGGRLGWKGCIKSQLAWDFFAYITPATIGGGPFVTVYMARDRHIPLGDATSIILFSMLIDQICFALTIPVLLVFALYVDLIPASIGGIGFWTITLYFAGFMTWVAVFGYFTLLRPEHLERAVDGLFRLKPLRRFRDGLHRVARDMEERAAIFRSQPFSYYVKGAILTFLPWISRYLLVLFVIWSIYPGLDVLLVFLRSVALHVTSIALPTPGGAGGVEGLYAVFLGPLMPRPYVGPTLLVWRFLSYYLFLLIGAVIMMQQLRKTIRKKQLAPAGREVHPDREMTR